MDKLENLQGSIVALVTPFNFEKKINYNAIETLIEFHIQSKTDGILVCGTTGETPTLNDKEYKSLVGYVVDKVNGRVPVIAGTGTNSTQKTIENCRIAEEKGADVLLVVGPYYNKPTPKGFYLHFSEVAKNTSLPIILYNVPGRTGKNIPTDIILRLGKKFLNIVGVKEASGDLQQIMELIKDRPDDFKIYSGDDSLAFSMTVLGGDGCISVVANEIPRQFSRMLHHVLNNEIEQARKLHFKYLHLMNLNFIETNPIPVKTALSIMGLVEENFRLPMCRMEEANKNMIKGELKRLELI